MTSFQHYIFNNSKKSHLSHILGGGVKRFNVSFGGTQPKPQHHHTQTLSETEDEILLNSFLDQSYPK